MEIARGRIIPVARLDFVQMGKAPGQGCQFARPEMPFLMHKFRKYWIDAIAVCAILAAFAYYAQRPYSWLLDHECPETGTVIADETFVKNGFEFVASGWVKRTSRSSYDNTYEDLFAQYPDCCSIYQGPPADYMQPPSWWQIVTNAYAKAVLVKLDIKSKQNGDYRTLKHSRLVTLDACGNNVPN